MDSKKEEKAAVQELVVEKERLEKEIIALNGSIDRMGGERLMDEQGFPRADIDVYSIRTLQSQRARLQTDHKTLMARLEAALRTYHLTMQSSGAAPGVAGVAASREPVVSIATDSVSRAPAPFSISAAPSAIAPAPVRESPAALSPFYLIDQVWEVETVADRLVRTSLTSFPAQDSPAYVAGLKIGDKILQFGTITKQNQTPQSMSQVVQNSVGRPIPVTVYRNGEGLVEVHVLPQRWSGQGLLGCHLTPINE